MRFIFTAFISFFFASASLAGVPFCHDGSAYPLLTSDRYDSATVCSNSSTLGPAFLQSDGMLVFSPISPAPGVVDQHFETIELDVVDGAFVFLDIRAAEGEREGWVHLLGQVTLLSVAGMPVTPKTGWFGDTFNVIGPDVRFAGFFFDVGALFPGATKVRLNVMVFTDKAELVTLRTKTTCDRAGEDVCEAL